MECKKAENIKGCTCSYNCGKRGMCCDCVTQHRASNQIPGCFFPAAVEKTYDRSYKRFAQWVMEGK